ncbi:ExeA family protein [Xanthomonas citri]|uniref:ExeA family protein n=1 Tax=Xanthomonas citri TaxID=346 RepID=UPI0003018C73|nr:AAA family ATPase [Xanthomonas citri]AMV00305.1 transposase [Xanthomonas citri pv. aurantifolii]AMV04621.1 transposase [Xanthomonas citri pv. aurantifolii]MCC8491356.1 AAA family ATPase [Xanthomonas citri pv. fuscans]TBW97621.1 transposase [Xanthomonas citri pv. aurantifolii]TBW99027.1 transposase [Xanthomonas citri pv. aurantifolii]
MTLRLKSMLSTTGITQGKLARAVGLSRPALNGLINHGALPTGADRDAIEQAIRTYLRNKGVADAASWLEPEPPCANTTAPEIPPPQDPAHDEISDEEIHMLLRFQSLTPQARRHFGLAGNPFAEPTSAEEVFLSPDIRYVRESMYQVARHGGFAAVIGESGAGKSTLREELIDRIRREEQAVIVIEPYVLASEGSDAVGKTLRSHHIAESIMAAVAPLAKAKSSPEARFRQLHEVLRDSARAGHSHVLVIEEAHSLPLPTLKHLKRFRELKDGLRPLLSVILIGQPELGVKLSEHNPEVREVVQRIEIIMLPTLGTELEAYLGHRFKRVQVSLDKVMDRGAVDALRTKLTPSRGEGSLLYPLAVHNALTAAMNRAADLGVPTVTADVVRGV